MLRTITFAAAALFLASGISMVWQIGTERVVGSVVAVLLIAFSTILFFTAAMKMAGKQNSKKA